MTTTFYGHWRDVPDRAWRWRNFSPAEIACRGTGKLLINEPALDKQTLRDRLGKPLIVRSAYRRLEHNRAVGGAKRSKHMEGAAPAVGVQGRRAAGASASRSRRPVRISQNNDRQQFRVDHRSDFRPPFRPGPSD